MLGIGKICRMPNARIRERLCGVKNALNKGLMEVFSNGLAILKEWEIVGLQRYGRECAWDVVNWVDREKCVLVQ